MKTIYVTVKEFIDNGGVLRYGRVLYRHDEMEIGTFIERHPDHEADMIIVK